MKCCICGCEIIKKEMDPWPINYDDGTKCCTRCYTLTVLPAIVQKRRYLEEHGLTNSVEVESEVLDG